MSPKRRAGLSSEIKQSFKTNRFQDAEDLLNRFYPCLATIQTYGLCSALQLTKRCRLQQSNQSPYIFNVTNSDDFILYEGNFAELEEAWPVNRLLAYHQYLQSIELDKKTFKLHVGDCYETDEPVWVGCSNRAKHTLIPDSEFLGSRGYQSLRRLLTRHYIPFASRRDVLFWRGGVNCREDFTYPWIRNPRLRLCQYVRNLKLKIKSDVKVVGIDYIYKNIGDQQEIHGSGITGNSVKVQDFQKYKYHLDIDGYSNAWSGFFTKLLMGCVVFKVASAMNYKQWYYDGLIPYEHYIPVAPDLSNLEEQIVWALRNQRQCQIISNNASDFFKTNDFFLFE